MPGTSVSLSLKLHVVELAVETALVWWAGGLVSGVPTLGKSFPPDFSGCQFLLRATWGAILQTSPGSPRSP